MSPVPAVLGATLFLWQFPHFFSLAWIHRKDYARGGHQMVPVNDPDGERTANLVLGYSLCLLPIPILAATTEVTSYMYAVEGVAASSYMVYLANKFRNDRTNDNAREVFKCSLWYLPLLLALLVFHRIEDPEKDANQISLSMRAKAYLRAICLHEVISTPGGGKVMCPKVDAVEHASSPTQSSTTQSAFQK